MRITSILPLAFLLILTGPLSPAIAETLSWKEAVEETIRANPSLRSSEENLNAARFQTKAAYGGFLPQVTGNFDYSRGGRSSSTPGTLTPSAGGSLSTDDSSFYSFSVNARQNLFAGFSDAAKIGQGKANETIAGSNVGLAKAQASFDLKSAFADMQFAQDSVALAQNIIKRRRDNQDLVELRYQSGGENKGSLLLSQAYYQDARYDLLQAENAVETARQRLARVLGRETLKGVRVTGSVPLTSPSKLESPERLLEQNPEVKKSIGQKRLAKENVRAARSNFYPAVDLNAAAGRQGDRWFPEENRWSVGVGVSLPLFSGGTDYHNLKGAKSKLLAAEYDQTSTANNVRVKLIDTHKAYTESVQRVATDRAFLKAAEARAEIARSKYNNGLISFEDWDIIESDLIARQKAALASRRDRVTSEAAWEQAQGRGIFDE